MTQSSDSDPTGPTASVAENSRNELPPVGSVVCLDIEACSLDSGSYPIEIAWVHATGLGESYLISPRFDWKGWSPASEKLHGISRLMLDREGIPAMTVAQTAYDALCGRVICSDNPAFDDYWLGMLMEVINQPPLDARDFDRLRSGEQDRLIQALTLSNTTAEEARQYMAEVDAQEAIRQRRRHRALPDATSLWRRWHALELWMQQAAAGHDGR